RAMAARALPLGAAGGGAGGSRPTILLPVRAAGIVRALFPHELGRDPRDGAAVAGDGGAVRALHPSALPAVRLAGESPRPRAARVPRRRGGPAGAVRVLRPAGADGGVSGPLPARRLPRRPGVPQVPPRRSALERGRKPGGRGRDSAPSSRRWAGALTR